MNRIALDLQWFTEVTGGGEAAAAPDAGNATGSENAAVTNDTESAAPIRAGDTLPNGQKVQSAKVAAELERQMKRHPELRKVYQGQVQPAQQAEEQQNQPQEMTIQEKWEAAKKGEFRELYGQDVQAAIKDRFKNQNDAQGQLDALQPMLQLLMNKAGVDNVDELREMIMSDDSLIEDEAEAAGMTVERYRQFKELQEEHDRRAEQDRQAQEDAFWQDHFKNLATQAVELQKLYPDFNLKEELNNETFKRLTLPGSGVSLEAAYYAVHHKELGPQYMAYGMQRAREQASQTIQAQRARPAEGAMRSQAPVAANMKLDFSKLTRKERDAYRARVHSGKEKGGSFA